MAVAEWWGRRTKALPEVSTQDNKLNVAFIPKARTVYGIFHQDADGERLVNPLFVSERRATVRCSRLKVRTGESYYVAPLELRE